MDCIECHKPNPEDNRYCGQCGAELGRTLDETVRKRGFSDRQATESEITHAVAERMMKWVTWLGGVAGVLTALFVFVLGKGYMDIHTTVQEGKADITTAVHQGKADIDEINQATPGLKAQVKQLQSDMTQYTNLVSQVRNQSKDLKGVEDRYQALLSEVRNTQQSLVPITKVAAKADLTTPYLLSVSGAGNFGGQLKIIGYNFGGQQGQVYVRSLGSAFTPLMGMGSQPMPALVPSVSQPASEVQATVLSWTDNQITVQAPLLGVVEVQV